MSQPRSRCRECYEYLVTVGEFHLGLCWHCWLLRRRGA